MFDIPDLTIRVEAPASDGVADLIKRASEGQGDASADLDAPNAELLVARIDGKPVGCIALLDHLRFGEAKRLYVAPDARGRGVGAALVTALESAARDIGLRVVKVSASDDGKRLRTRFESFGYTIAEAARGRSGAVMEKCL